MIPFSMSISFIIKETLVFDVYIPDLIISNAMVLLDKPRVIFAKPLEA